MQRKKNKKQIKKILELLDEEKKEIMEENQIYVLKSNKSKQHHNKTKTKNLKKNNLSNISCYLIIAFCILIPIFITFRILKRRNKINSINTNLDSNLIMSNKTKNEEYNNTINDEVISNVSNSNTTSSSERDYKFNNIDNIKENNKMIRNEFNNTFNTESGENTTTIIKDNNKTFNN